ncbi:thrombospondin type 3 repeat-containing protein [Pyxidicoccus xibeiensis]|uniref:thrombospondin type 3 repeat-containing protein n=1 Tax=Pyxidicoccus xibeiensis TaxID=2906759 RepID=UPI0020A6F07F|nr:thrombospondin type 3 repeat-containing protein [Pyxidicoccus xibeiensis]MCP3144942.1 thrombospondin type 3 repeat-containing protein [Pyxidicoccus xibeiensis]
MSKRWNWLLALAVVCPLMASAATTGDVYLVLKNGGVGTFKASALRVYANSDYASYNKTAYSPTVPAAPGQTFTVSFRGLYVWSGYQGNYQFDVNYTDTSVKKVTVAAGTKFPTGTRALYVSQLGVTTYNPGAAYAFSIVNDPPPGVTMRYCSPEYPNRATDLWVAWSGMSYFSDFSKAVLQRTTPGSSFWATVTTGSYGFSSHVDRGRLPSTTYRYRVAIHDNSDAITYSEPIECATASSDADGDGHVATALGGDDCNDNSASIHPGATEVPGDGVDQDCDGSDLVLGDADGDGVLDASDNCPAVSNANQSDLDTDGAGDACDTDDDADGVEDLVDNCPVDANANQADVDGDTVGDVCDPDDDEDGIMDTHDNCPRLPNPDQADADLDGVGDACEAPELR